MRGLSFPSCGCAGRRLLTFLFVLAYRRLLTLLFALAYRCCLRLHIAGLPSRSPLLQAHPRHSPLLPSPNVKQHVSELALECALVSCRSRTRILQQLPSRPPPSPSLLPPRSLQRSRCARGEREGYRVRRAVGRKGGAEVQRAWLGGSLVLTPGSSSASTTLSFAVSRRRRRRCR